MHVPPQTHRRFLTNCVVAVLLAALPPTASGQGRLEVGAALQALTGALAGDAGGTRARIETTLQTFGTALSAWDTNIASIEKRMRATLAQSAPHDRASIRTTLGGIYFERGRFADALGEFAQALRDDPALPTARLMQALTFEALGQVSAARDALAAALALAPSDPVIAYHLSRLTDAGDDPTTLSPATTVLLDAAVRSRTEDKSSRMPFVAVPLVDDGDPVPYRFLPAGYGIVVVPLLASQQYDAAYAALRELVLRDPLLDDPALTSEAFAAAANDVDAGHPEAALARLAAAETRLKGSSEFHRLRAVALRRAAQPAQAVAEFETAVQLAPRNERAATSLISWAPT